MLYAICLKTIPRGVPSWLGHADVVYIGPVAEARKFNLPADAECYLKDRTFDGFTAEVVKVSDENQWD